MPAVFLLAVGTDRDSSGGVTPHGAEVQAVLTDGNITVWRSYLQLESPSAVKTTCLFCLQTDEKGLWAAG